MIERCTESRAQQKVVTRHIGEDYIEQAEDIRHSPLGKETYAKRSETIERVFADAKEKHAMRYTPYRGLSQVTNWVRLKVAAMNLKKIAMWKFKNRVSLDCETRFFRQSERTAFPHFCEFAVRLFLGEFFYRHKQAIKFQYCACS